MISKKPASIRPPSWLSRPEKRLFLSLIEARNDAGKPISAAEVFVLADLVSARSRLAELLKMWKSAAARARQYPPNERHVLAIARAIDATTATSRRLARELGLE